MKITIDVNTVLVGCLFPLSSHVLIRSVIYLQHGSWPGFRGPRHYDVDEGDRKFVFDVKKPTLRDIDRPKPRSEVIAAAHQSERGWKLPKDHPRHILSLPVGELIMKTTNE